MKSLLKIFFILVSFSLTCCIKTGKKTNTNGDSSSESKTPLTLLGTFQFIQDSTGQTPNENAVITINFRKNGTFIFQAEMPNQVITDHGTYKIKRNILNIIFNEMEQEEKNGVFEI